MQSASHFASTSVTSVACRLVHGVTKGVRRWSRRSAPSRARGPHRQCARARGAGPDAYDLVGGHLACHGQGGEPSLLDLVGHAGTRYDGHLVTR
jgi:hypothetical protein